ncbi:MAG: hypothetical protein U9R08_00995 [Nanoarchaeota archaeon]|nr:hypothetical protein [Nanoarchaeota archaeon]
MEEKLKEFYNDKKMQESLVSFLIEHNNRKALEDVYSGKETAHYKLSADLLASGFKSLNDKFEPKKDRKTKSRGI